MSKVQPRTPSGECKPVAQTVLMRERRQLRRRVAAAIVTAMAESDCDFKKMSSRCGRSEKSIRQTLHALIEGKEVPGEIEYFSDVLLSMGYEPVLNLTPLSEYAK